MVYSQTHTHAQRERLVRENMIAEQNRAYQESLDADRQKVQRKECIKVIKLYLLVGKN